MFFWVLIILLINAVVTFAYVASSGVDPSTVWGMLSMSFIFCVGISQAGVVFSVIMRLTKSGWGRYYSRLGEILTLSFAPVTAITFAVIYIGGMEHLFYWAAPAEHGPHGGGHVSPWLGKGLFLFRFVVTMALFYLASFIYFRKARAEERAGGSISEKANICGAFVLVFYVLANTNFAWEFGMTIIKHWESSIFAPYFWCANLLAGLCFIFLTSLYFIPRPAGEAVDKNLVHAMSKTLFGFVLLIIYLFWSQHIILWYGNLPVRTGPIVRQMSDEYGIAFRLMILTILVVPFLSLLFMRVKRSATALSVVAFILCFAVLVNRYLMVIPVYSDSRPSAVAFWAGAALVVGGVASILLSVKVFTKLFPAVTMTTGVIKKGH